MLQVAGAKATVCNLELLDRNLLRKLQGSTICSHVDQDLIPALSPLILLVFLHHWHMPSFDTWRP